MVLAHDHGITVSDMLSIVAIIVAVGIVAALRRLPFVVVVLLAAGTTAVLRQLGLT